MQQVGHFVETVVDTEFGLVVVVVYLVAVAGLYLAVVAVVVVAEYSAGVVGFLAAPEAQVVLVVASQTGYLADCIVVPLDLDRFVEEFVVGL